MSSLSRHDSADQKADVAIIGAGPVGMFSVFACGMMRLSCALIDSQEELGGQCSMLYPEKPIYDIPGFPAISGSALIDNLKKQITPFSPLQWLNQTVGKLEKSQENFFLTTSKARTIRAKAIIIAGGAGSFTPKRLPLQEASIYENKSLFYSIQNKKSFKKKHVVIAGGGDSAVDWALLLAEYAASITLVHRRKTFRAAPDSINQLQSATERGTIRIIAPATLQSLAGIESKGLLQQVRLKFLEAKEESEKNIPCEALLAFFGLEATLGPITDWNLQLNKNQIAIDPTTAATSRSGIFAVGDIAYYPCKRKLIATGFAEAAQAAAAIRKMLYPKQPTLIGHSTATGIPDLN